MLSQRLFFGIELPREVQRSIFRLLPKAGRGLSPTPSQNIHVTLRFLGDTEEEERDRVCEAMRSVTVAPFTLTLEGTGCFPPRGAPRVVWLGLGSAHPNLFQLRQQMDDALVRLGVPCEIREFVPHVTVARIRPGGAGAAQGLVRSLANFGGPTFAVKRFTLFASELTSEGSRYTEVAHFPLEGGEERSP